MFKIIENSMKYLCGGLFSIAKTFLSQDFSNNDKVGLSNLGYNFIKIYGDAKDKFIDTQLLYA